MHHQQINVHIDAENICKMENKPCALNGSSECWSCSVGTGSSKFSVKFKTGKASDFNTLDQKKIIIQLPPRPEEVKAPSEDDLDEGTFVYFVAPKILHWQSSRIDGFHRHYLMSGWRGNYCALCGGVSTNNEHTCEFCKSMLELEYCFVMADKIHLPEAILKAY